MGLSAVTTTSSASAPSAQGIRAKIVSVLLALFQTVLEIIEDKPPFEIPSQVYSGLMTLNIFQICGYIFCVGYDKPFLDEKWTTLAHVNDYSTGTFILASEGMDTVTLVFFCLIEFVIYTYFTYVFVLCFVKNRRRSFYFTHQKTFKSINQILVVFFTVYYWIFLPPFTEISLGILSCNENAFLTAYSDELGNCDQKPTIWIALGIIGVMLSVITNLIIVFFFRNYEFMESNLLKRKFSKLQICISLSFFGQQFLYYLTTTDPIMIYLCAQIMGVSMVLDISLNYPFRVKIIQYFYILGTSYYWIGQSMMTFWIYDDKYDGNQLFFMFCILVAFLTFTLYYDRIDFYTEELLRLADDQSDDKTNRFKIYEVVTYHKETCVNLFCVCKHQSFRDEKNQISQSFILKLIDCIFRDSMSKSQIKQNIFELEHLNLKYVTFIARFAHNPVQAYYQLKSFNYQQKHRTSSYFEAISMVLSTSLEHRIIAHQNSKFVDQATSLASPLISLSAIVQTDLIKQQAIPLLIGQVSEKIKFWNSLKLGFPNMDAYAEVALNFYKKSQSIKKTFSDIIGQPGFKQIKANNAVIMKILAIFECLVQGEFQRSVDYEQQVLDLRKRDEYKPSDLIHTINIMNGNVTSFQASLTQDRGHITSRITESHANFFHYSYLEMKSIKNIKELMMPHIASIHDVLVENYMDRGHSDMLHSGISTFALDRSGFVFPLHIALSSIFDKFDNFCVNAIMNKYHQGKEFLLCDSKGTNLGMTRGFFASLFFHGIMEIFNARSQEIIIESKKDFSSISVFFFLPKLIKIIESYRNPAYTYAGASVNANTTTRGGNSSKRIKAAAENSQSASHQILKQEKAQIKIPQNIYDLHLEFQKQNKNRKFNYDDVSLDLSVYEEFISDNIDNRDRDNCVCSLEVEFNVYVEYLHFSRKQHLTKDGQAIPQTSETHKVFKIEFTDFQENYSNMKDDIQSNNKKRELKTFNSDTFHLQMNKSLISTANNFTTNKKEEEPIKQPSKDRSTQDGDTYDVDHTSTNQCLSITKVLFFVLTFTVNESYVDIQGTTHGMRSTTLFSLQQQLDAQHDFKSHKAFSFDSERIHLFANTLASPLATDSYRNQETIPAGITSPRNTLLSIQDEQFTSGPIPLILHSEEQQQPLSNRFQPYKQFLSKLYNEPQQFHQNSIATHHNHLSPFDQAPSPSFQEINMMASYHNHNKDDQQSSQHILSHASMSKFPSKPFMESSVLLPNNTNNNILQQPFTEIESQVEIDKNNRILSPVKKSHSSLTTKLTSLLFQKRNHLQHAKQPTSNQRINSLDIIPFPIVHGSSSLDHAKSHHIEQQQQQQQQYTHHPPEIELNGLKDQSRSFKKKQGKHNRIELNQLVTFHEAEAAVEQSISSINHTIRSFDNSLIQQIAHKRRISSSSFINIILCYLFHLQTLQLVLVCLSFIVESAVYIAIFYDFNSNFSQTIIDSIAFKDLSLQYANQTHSQLFVYEVEEALIDASHLSWTASSSYCQEVSSIYDYSLTDNFNYLTSRSSKEEYTLSLFSNKKLSNYDANLVEVYFQNLYAIEKICMSAFGLDGLLNLLANYHTNCAISSSIMDNESAEMSKKLDTLESFNFKYSLVVIAMFTLTTFLSIPILNRTQQYKERILLLVARINFQEYEEEVMKLEQCLMHLCNTFDGWLHENFIMLITTKPQQQQQQQLLERPASKTAHSESTIASRRTRTKSVKSNKTQQFSSLIVNQKLPIWKNITIGFVVCLFGVSFFTVIIIICQSKSTDLKPVIDIFQKSLSSLFALQSVLVTGEVLARAPLIEASVIDGSGVSSQIESYKQMYTDNLAILGNFTSSLSLILSQDTTFTDAQNNELKRLFINDLCETFTSDSICQDSSSNNSVRGIVASGLVSVLTLYKSITITFSELFNVSVDSSKYQDTVDEYTAMNEFDYAMLKGFSTPAVALNEITEKISDYVEEETSDLLQFVLLYFIIGGVIVALLWLVVCEKIRNKINEDLSGISFTLTCIPFDKQNEPATLFMLKAISKM